MKIFLLRDGDTKEAVGFMTGIIFRPITYKAVVFQVQDYYVRDGSEIEQLFMNEVVAAIKIIGLDEIWLESFPDRPLHCTVNWKLGGEFIVRRFIKNSLV